MDRSKKLDILACVVTAVVWTLVVLMRKFRIPLDVDLGFLPAVNALLNTGTSMALLAAYFFIRKKDVESHRKSIYTAMLLSALFLLTYVAYHITTAETSFGGTGVWRGVYYFLLITHIILAGLILPFVLFTFIRGYTGQVERHRKMARWVWPIWLYVALSGPLCYLMLKPYY